MIIVEREVDGRCWVAELLGEKQKSTDLETARLWKPSSREACKER